MKKKLRENNNKHIMIQVDSPIGTPVYNLGFFYIMLIINKHINLNLSNWSTDFSFEINHRWIQNCTSCSSIVWTIGDPVSYASSCVSKFRTHSVSLWGACKKLWSHSSCGFKTGALLRNDVFNLVSPIYRTQNLCN